MPKIKLTEKAIQRLEFSEAGQVDYFDLVTPGFGLRVGKATKTYFVMKKINGKDARKSIGRNGNYSLEEARAIAFDYLHDMRKGINPTEKERQQRLDAEAEKLKDLTLDQVFREMLSIRASRIKVATASWYEQLLNLYAYDWLNKPLRHITKNQIIALHNNVADSAGKGSADGLLRVIRAIWNFGKNHYDGVFGDNPVNILSSQRLWHNLPRRERHIENHKLKLWYDAVLTMPNPIIRDYLLLVLFTGMRRSEAAGLRWDDIDFEGLSLRVKDTKNGKPLQIPLNSFLLGLLKRRHEESENKYVFPGTGRTGHLVEPKRAIDNVTKKTGIPFSSHDLRRTLLSIGTDEYIHPYVLKALVNHTIAERKDVTEGYSIITLERMRKPSQQLCDRIMELCGIPKEPGKVIDNRTWAAG